MNRCLFLFFILMCFFSTSAAQEYDIQSAGHVGGHFRGLYVQAPVAAVGNGNSVAFYDLENNDQIYSTIVLDEQVEDIFIYNDLCIVLLTGDHGLYIYDISEIETPDSLSYFPLDAGWGKKLFVSDEKAFVTNVFTKALTIIDISTPENPLLLSTYDCIARDVCVIDSTAFVAAGEGLLVLDVSTASEPVLIGSLNSGNYHAIDIEGDRAVLAGGLSSVLADISDPQNPQFLSTFEIKDNSDRQTVRTIAMDDRAIYAVNTRGKLFVLNISDPQNPVQVSNYELVADNNPHSVWIEDFDKKLYAVISSLDQGFKVIDLADINEPMFSESLQAPSDVRTLLVHRDHLYVASWFSLWRYRLTDPAQPDLINVSSQYDQIAELKAWETLLFAVTYEGEIICLDIGDPGHFTELSRYQTVSGSIKTVFVTNGFLYAGVSNNGNGALEILDYHDASSPQKLSSFSLPGEPRDITADSQRVYVAYYDSDYDKGFQVIDISNPATPNDNGTAQAAFKPYCIEKTGSFVLVGSTGSFQWSLQSFAVSDSASPKHVDLVEGSGMIWDVETAGPAVFASVMGNSVMLYELNDGTLVFKKICHSPGSGQLSILPPDALGNGYTYTQEGSPSPEEFGGEKGIVIQIFKIPPDTPIEGAALVLGMGSTGGSLICPPDSGEKVVIANVSLHALYDSWRVNNISFVSTGNRPASDIDKAYLEIKGNLVETDVQGTGDGFSMQFPVGKVLQEGETLSMTLYYTFSYYQDGESGVPGAPEAVSLYGVYSAANRVGAQWLTMDEGGILPAIPQKVFSPVTRIAPVWNVSHSQKLPFASIQSGIDDVRTQTGDRLWICPCKIKDNVIVHKGVTIYSSMDHDQAIVEAAEQNRHVFDIQTSDVEIRNLTIQKAGRMAGIHFSKGDYDSCLVVNNRIQKNLNGISVDGGVNLDIWGNQCIHNDNAGIEIRNGTWISIGDQNADEKNAMQKRNVLSGNALCGLYFNASDAAPISVINNFIGLSADGLKLMPNKIGVYLDNVAGYYIGRDSTRTTLHNVISGNTLAGVLIDNGSHSNYITNNYIGTMPDGMTAAANGNGIVIQNGSRENSIEGNVISGNVDIGISINGEGSLNNWIRGNMIGVDVRGLQEVANRIGIYISSGAHKNEIGTKTTTNKVEYGGNIISGNKAFGIQLEGNVKQTLVVNNTIGLNRTGNAAIPNTTGFYLSGGVCATIIGRYKRDNSKGYNVISGNRENGIQVHDFVQEGEYITSNFILWNYIGTDAAGNKAIPNNCGVYLASEAQRVVVSKNIIAGNRIGVDIHGVGTCRNEIYDNHIGYNLFSGLIEMIPNHIGIRLRGGTHLNKIGLYHDGNYIAANDTGIVLSGNRNRLTFYNIIKNNYIGTDENDWQNIGNKVGLSIGPYTQNNLVVHNDFKYNQIHLKGKGDRNNIFQNTFKGGRSRSTALRLDGSKSKIMGNFITQDAGDAIHTTNGADPHVEKNNITDNQGYGLVNSDESVTVFARNNWWGDASGPGGVMGGNGDEISGNVDAANYRDQAIGLVINAAPDTLFIRKNNSDSLQLSVQNWQSTHSTVNVTISDSLDWSAWSNLVLTLQNGNGADTLIHINPPPQALSESVNKIEFRASKSDDPAVTDEDSVYAVIYRADLDRIYVYPDSAVLNPNESMRFNAIAVDKKNHPVNMDLIWQAQGGSIDSTGLYTAGTAGGLYAVTAMNPAGTIKEHIWVRIKQQTAVESMSKEIPEKFFLYPNYPNPFNPQTCLNYDLPQKTHVMLKVYDVLGRQRITLVNQVQNAGHHKVHLFAADWPAGIYIYHLQTKTRSAFGKMILLK